MKNKIQLYDINAYETLYPQNAEVTVYKGENKTLINKGTIFSKSLIKGLFHISIILLIGIYQVLKRKIKG